MDDKAYRPDSQYGLGCHVCGIAGCIGTDRHPGAAGSGDVANPGRHVGRLGFGSTMGGYQCRNFHSTRGFWSPGIIRGAGRVGGFGRTHWWLHLELASGSFPDRLDDGKVSPSASFLETVSLPCGLGNGLNLSLRYLVDDVQPGVGCESCAGRGRASLYSGGCG